MILKTKQTISIEKAEELLEKYYEGRTTLAEENQLHLFLAREDVPEHFSTEKAVFRFFEEKKNNAKKRTINTQFLKWVGAAAVAAAIVTGVLLFPTSNTEYGYAYVNGEKITDVESITKLAYASMESLLPETDEIEEVLNSINSTNEILEKQLEQFSSIDFSEHTTFSE